VFGVVRGLIRHLTRPPATLSPVEAERTQNGWCGGLKNTWSNRKELKEHRETRNQQKETKKSLFPSFPSVEMDPAL
jgi:hypothetical protein